MALVQFISYMCYNSGIYGYSCTCFINLLSVSALTCFVFCLIFFPAQRDPPSAGKIQEEKAITGLLDGSGEYTLVYEDNEGDRMLVGDVPWQ